MAHIHRKSEFQILGLTNQEMIWLFNGLFFAAQNAQASPDEMRFYRNLRADIEKEARISGTALSAKSV